MSVLAEVLKFEQHPRTEPAPSMRLNAFWNLAGCTFYAACQWGLISILAKMGGANQVGQFALALSVSAPVFMLGNLQLRALQTTDAEGRHSFADYLSLRLTTSLCSLAVVDLLASFLSEPPTVRWIVAAVALVKMVEAVADIYQGVFQKCERMDLLARSLFLKGAGSLAAFGLMYWFSHNLLWSAIAMAAAQLVTLSLYDAPRSLSLTLTRSLAVQCGRFDRPRWRRNHITGILKSAVPLGITMMLISLQVNVPRLSIRRCLGIRDLGMFAAISYFPIAGTMIVSAIGSAAVPRLAAHCFQRQKRKFRNLLGQLVVVAAAFGLMSVAACAACGPRVLRILYGEAYASQHELLIWMMAGGCVSYILSMFGFAATAMEKFCEQPIILAISTVTLFVACELLLPRYGLVGAAWAILICAAVGLAGYVNLVFRK